MTYIPENAIRSTLNTTTTPLASGATYTGTWELNNARDVGVSCKTDVSGTLYFDFSNDGVNADPFPPAGFNVTAGIHEFHIGEKLPRYFRVRLVNGAGNQTYLRLYTYFGEFRQGNAPIGFDISNDADAIVTKSVISGIGDTTAKVTDHRALQVTYPQEQKTAFGDAVSAEATSLIDLTFPNKINLGVVNTKINNAGTVTQANSMAVASTGTSNSSSALMESKNIIKYVPGVGIAARFTALFSEGVTGSMQLVGIGSPSDGFFFGYNGTDFGILHRRNGSVEIRTLTITTASSTTESITVTLDGVAVSVPVTNSGVISTTVNEIASYNYRNVGTGWTAYAVGNKVEFVSWKAKIHSGAFSVTGSTVIGTFAQNVVGKAPTDEWILQSSWNGEDKFDGTGITGVTLNPLKGNVFQIKYQWLGFGAIFFFVEDPDDGELHLVHTIEYANLNDIPSLSDPSLRLMIYAENTTNTTNIVTKTASMGGLLEGKFLLTGFRFGIGTNKTGITTTPVPLISLRVGLYDNARYVNTLIKVLRLHIAVEHTKPMYLITLANPVLTGANWTPCVSGITASQYDTSATAYTGGIELARFPLGKSDSVEIDYSGDIFAALAYPGNILSLAVATTSSTGGEASVGVNILEKA